MLWEDGGGNPASYPVPSADMPEQHTTYFAVISPQGLFPPRGPRKMAEVADSAADTLAVVEVFSTDHAHWMAPVDVTEDQVWAMLRSEKLPHATATQALGLAGWVQALSLKTTAAELHALVTVADDEPDEAASAR